MSTKTTFRVAMLGLGFVLGGVAVVGAETYRSQQLNVLERLNDVFWWPAAVGGVLLVNTGFVLSQRPVPRAVWVLVACNVAAWAAYLAFTPRLTQIELAELDTLRQSLESADGISFIEDGPSMLAGRRHGFWPIDTPHQILVLFAGPALEYGEYVALSPRFSPPPKLAESYFIAAIAFLWSTSFWATAGSLVRPGYSAIRRLTTACSRRRPGGS